MLNRLLTAGTVAGTTLLSPWAGVAATAAAGAVSDQPLDSADDRHCVVEASRTGVTVVDQAPMRCYSSFADSLSGRAAGNITIATHWQYSNGMGTAIEFRGPDCSDTWITSDTWQNMSSTRVSSSCAGAKHYTGTNCSGYSQIIESSSLANLGGSVNNNVRCVKYA